ncbi:helix-turn-helix domain-containing protein [Aphanothece sacrum]|uniref:helix-turn-helix domain-containing protein n=1 Tax=Aphanothece sacrum TaxID=1122 RepID=UPI000FFAE008|nr:helix-turn-helix transcriptional regulator [Aphanothece sacrum]GBF87171.1 DNA-binding helix-turn-helix protein [Aphanothece sacrum FPU3]
MKQDTREVNKPLKDLIEERGYTQKSFAEALGLAYSTVKFYVARQKTPGTDITAKMCVLLEKSPKQVMTALGIDVSGIPDDKTESLKPSNPLAITRG